MYDETEYIYQEFRQHFAGKKKQPLVLYGIGKNTGKLLERIHEYHIVGLMDGKRKEGTIWKKPILDYEDILRLNVRTIVVIARPAVIGVIYHRIAKFCAQNRITAYDVQGNDLSEIYVEQENEIPYFHIKFQDLERAVEKHNIVSFDVFDTLIMRKVLYPADIFRMVEKKLGLKQDKHALSFALLRVEAERQLYDEEGNPTFDEIYDRIQKLSGINEACRNEWQALEIATEMELLVPRKKMLELFNSIKGKKKVYLLSDMYLSSPVIAQMLRSCGYDGYEGLYVSCEKGMSKNEGLFTWFADEMKKKGYGEADCIHIGDNYAADILSAREAGLDTFHIMSALELLESSSYRKLLATELSFFDHFAIGLLCERAFQDPFVLYGTKGKRRIGNLQDFAYILLAPMIFYFTVWMMRQVLRFKCDYVLYPSRDAYLIEKLCAIIRKKQKCDQFPEGEYFYTSRRAVLAATIWNETDIKYIAEMDFGGSIKQLFKQRFNIDVKSSAGDIEAENAEELTHYTKRYQKEILAKSEKERDNYIRYISGTGISGHSTIAFIDFVAAGKIQNGLEKLVLDKDFLGFYFLRREPDKGEIDRDIRIESFFPSKGAFEIDLNVYKYYLFLEMILTSPEATFCSFDDNGRKHFMKETRSDDHRRIVREIQESILEYTEEFAALYPKILSEPVDHDIPDRILGLLDQEYTTLDLHAAISLVLTDEFIGQTFNIFQV